jgi:hypothetical protein
LSEKGLAWPLVHESLQENNTIENIERIVKAAKAHGFEVFISPRYFYPTDKGWKFDRPLETDEAASGYPFANFVLVLIPPHFNSSLTEIEDGDDSQYL